MATATLDALRRSVLASVMIVSVLSLNLGAIPVHAETDPAPADPAPSDPISSTAATFTYVANSGGSISGSATQTIGVGESTTPVTAVPESGYHFTQWDDSNTNPTRTDTYTAPGSQTFTASFDPDPTPGVTTDHATAVGIDNATVNGTNGAVDADNTSFWWGTTSEGPFTPAADPSSEFPAGWNQDGGLGAAPANGAFNELLSSLTSGTTYYFAAWSQVAGTWYPGAVESFTTDTDGGGGGGDVTPPTVPVLTSPANGTTLNTNDFDFTWDASTDDSAGPVTYEFQSSLDGTVDGDGVLQNGVWHSGTLSTPMIHSSGAPDGTWYWQVRAKDTSGNYSAWTSVWTVTLDTAGPTGVIYVATTGSDSTGDGSQANPYATIQKAVDESTDGDTISVGAGSFDAFSVDGKTSLTIMGAGAGTTMIVPSTLVDTGVGHKYTSDVKTSVFVNDSTNVTLEDLTVEDNGATPGSGGPDALVFWNASTGDITDADIQATYTINGVQTGQGIAVDGGSGDTTDLTITNTTIEGFQKNGIDAVDGNALTGNGGTITLDVEGGSITGAGSIGTIAQNGILIWNRGGGTVTGMVHGTAVSDLEYTGADADTGIYAYGTASYSTVSDVTFSNVDLYLVNGTGGAIDATSGNTFDGVTVSGATGAQLAAIENKLDGVMEDAGADPIYLLPHTLIATTDAVNRGIQVGLDTAVSGDTVLVTPGTYTGDLIVPTSDLTLKGIDTPVINLGSGYGINLDNPPMTPTGFTMTGFTVNASPSTTYAFKAYKADGLTLTDDTFNGGSGNTGGGVDVNTTSNVTFTNVTATGFHKNGFADTPAYTAGDDASAGDTITFDGITSTNNGWTGISFYSIGGSGGAANIAHASFAGSNTISGNGTGVFVEGASDADFGSHVTPSYTVTTDGSTLDLTHVAFSGNTAYDVLNYQTAPVNAIGATFGGLTGDDMTLAQRTTENGYIYDHLDLAPLGLVSYYTLPTLTITAPAANGDDVSGTYDFTADYEHGVTTNIQWAIRKDSCTTGTVAGNVDGHHDVSTFAGTTFTATLDTTSWDNGSYCFVVNPAEPSGYPDLRETRLFNVTNPLGAPSTPVLTSPTDGGYENTNDFYFDWDNSIAAISGPITYESQFTQDPTEVDGVLQNNLWASTTPVSTIHSQGASDGTWYWQVRAQDSHGTYSDWSSIWSVTIDTEAPTITLNGDATVTLTVGDAYTEEGATATDAIDGTDPVTVGGDTVDTGTAGTYVVTYDASDNAGNAAAQVTRTVIVNPASTTTSGRTGGLHRQPGSSAGNTGSTGGSVLGASVFNFATDFGIGSTLDPDVTELQKILIAAGYLNIPAPTGFFGPLTEAAVKLYQAAHGIIQTGFVGPLTRDALNQGTGQTESTGTGDISQQIADLMQQVKELQDQLDALNH
ncbi:MAG TPA: immunoglobulin-like domain-containing protein [Candidatus Paceibacterota bacterium]|nr:immunoglobulin-like domain-containing protein [Candidatus Paceibacterota bacterium]